MMLAFLKTVIFKYHTGEWKQYKLERAFGRCCFVGFLQKPAACF